MNSPRLEPVSLSLPPIAPSSTPCHGLLAAKPRSWTFTRSSFQDAIVPPLYPEDPSFLQQPQLNGLLLLSFWWLRGCITQVWYYGLLAAFTPNPIKQLPDSSTGLCAPTQKDPSLHPCHATISRSWIQGWKEDGRNSSYSVTSRFSHQHILDLSGLLKT